MADDQWDLSGSARRALQGIVADSQYGVAALSEPGVISNLLKDLLPEEPRESSLLVAAAQADLAGTLRGYLAQGMDVGTAARLTASGFVATTPHSPEAGTWVVNELALAIGLDATRPGGQETIASPLAQHTKPSPGFGGAAGVAAPGQPAFAAPAQPGYAAPGQTGWAGLAPAQPNPAQAPWLAPAQPQAASQERAMQVGAGIAGLVGVLFILLGSIVPFIKYPNLPPASIFGGYKGEPGGLTFWSSAEPAVVALICLVLAIMMLANVRPTMLTTGMLIAFGIEITLFFAAYAIAIYRPDKHEAGGWLGIIGGLAILAAGTVSYRYLRRQQAAGQGVSAAPAEVNSPAY
jgi:hypothetical protein